MQIHQLNVSHNDRHDRLLLRVNTQSAQEFRFWLTRRLTLRLIPALQQTVGRLESSMPQRVAPDAVSQQMLTELQRDAFLQKADFKTPYTEQVTPLPLGDEPLLVTDVQMQMPAGAVLLTLQDKGATAGQNDSCQLHLQHDLLHGLIHLLQQAVAQADWAGQLSPEVASEPTAEQHPVTGYRH